MAWIEEKKAGPTNSQEWEKDPRAAGLYQHPDGCDCSHPRCVEERAAVASIAPVLQLDPDPELPPGPIALELALEKRLERTRSELELSEEWEAAVESVQLGQDDELEDPDPVATAKARAELDAIAGRNRAQSDRLRREIAAKTRAMEILWDVLELALKAAPHVLESIGTDENMDKLGRAAANQVARYLRTHQGPLP